MKQRISNREVKRETLLASAAELIMRDGPKGVKLKELAERAGIARADVYAIFGTGAKYIMYETIVGRFLQKAKNSIADAVISTAPNSSAVEQLTAVLRVTLHLFKEDAHSGKVVLAYLDIKHAAFQPIHEVFKYIDFLVGKAVENGEIVIGFSTSEIRQVLFSVTYGLLRTLYLDHEEGKPGESQGEQALSEVAVQRAVLQVLGSFCSDATRAQVQSQMTALQKV